MKYIGIDLKEHTYLIDFKVFENDDSFYYIEVKGYTKENDYLKWSAVGTLGFRLKVWYNEQITLIEEALNE